MNQAIVPLSLYEQDFALWLSHTATCLQQRDIDYLDWDHLLEEIEALARSERQELENRLEVLLSHLLKRLYVSSPDDDCNWQGTIQEQRNQLKRLLKKSPSLKPYFAEVFTDVYQDALAQVCEVYPDTTFPTEWQFNLEIEAVLEERFWRSNQDGSL